MKTGKRILSALLCLIMLTGTVAVGGDGIARLFDAVSVEASAEVFNIVAKSSANISTTVTLEPCVSGSSLRRVPVYTLNAYAWVDGLPENIRSDQDPVFSWYFINSNYESIFLGTSDVFQTVYNDAGEPLTENVFSKQINRADIFNWSGSIYATVEFAGTNYDLINGQVLTTNKSTISVVSQTVYAQCVRVEGKTYTNSEGKTYVKEVKPEEPVNYSNNCYLGSSEQPDGYYYTVKFFPNDNCIEKERFFINSENEWHYHYALNNYEFNEPYIFEDYVKENENGGLVGTNSLLSGNDAKCYNKVVYKTADGRTNSIRIGTFDEYSGCRCFNTVMLSVSVDTDYQPVSLDIDTTNGKCGDNLFWSFDAETHTLTISGTGDMYDYGAKPQLDNYGNVPSDFNTDIVYLDNTPPWDILRRDIRKIDIQPGCTSVGDFAFFRCWYVRGIIFPEGVTKIGNYIFSNSLFNISSVCFPSTLANMGIRFAGYGGDPSFNHTLNICYNGSEEQFKSISGIGKEYYDYYNHQTVHTYQLDYEYNIFGGVSYFFNTKCYNDFILSVDNQANTARIIAYVGASENVDIPNEVYGYTVTGIDNRAFYNCVFTKSVTIPDTVTSIGAAAFIFSGIENFYIPKSVTKIGESAFLSVVSNYYVYERNSENYYWDQDFLIGSPHVIITSNANEKPLNDNGEIAYYPVLNNITVDPQNPYFSSDDNGVLYNKNKTVLFQYPLGSSRKSFVIPSSVKTIWNYAFKTSSCSDLERVYIPKSITLLTSALIDAGMIVDYEGSQTEWNSLIANSYPSYPECPNASDYTYYNLEDYNNYSDNYINYSNDIILYTQKYNYYYEKNFHYNEYDNSFWFDYCTINFNVTDPMNGVTPDSITYSWSSDGSSCTGTALYNDFNHTVTENATVTSRVYSNATCTAPGTTRYTATFNNTMFSTQYKDIQNISALGHSKKWVVTTTATCTREGVESYKCSRCGTVFETRTIDKLPHSYSSTVVNPTCTKGGYTTHTCSSCGDTYTDSYTSAAGHRYTDYVTKPTCTEQGYTLHYCSVCHDSYKDNYTDPAHTPGNPVVENASNTSCDVEGSYDEVVYCTKCGAEISREHKITVAGQHTPAEAVKENEIAATCETNGSYDLVVYCAICKNEITRKTVATQKTGHKDTNSDGMCDTCKQVVDKEKYNKYLVSKAKLKLPADTDVEYGASVTVKAKATGVPSGYYVALYDGGTLLAKGSNTEVSYTFPGEFTSTKKLTVKIIDADKKVQKDANGKDLTGTVEIKAKSSFFDKLIAFFKRLFKALPAVTVQPK